MPDAPPATQSKAEKLAHEAFLLSITSVLCGITALPAIIWAIRALIQVRKDGARKAAFRKAIFSLVFASGVSAFLIFIAISVLRTAQAEADDINCVENMKQLAVALKIYQMDNDDTFPPANRWCDAIQSNNLAIFHCPVAPKKQRCSYAINAKLGGIRNRGQIPDDTVLLYESDTGWNAAGGFETVVRRHPFRLNIAFTDGSIMPVKFEDLRKLRWDPSTNSPTAPPK